MIFDIEQNTTLRVDKSDVALSITLTAVVSLISIISVPLIMFSTIDFFQIDTFREISMVGISIKMFLVVTVPVIIGMIINNFAKNFINNQALLIQKISIILFALVFAAIYIEEWNNIISYILNAGTVALTLNLTMMIIGFYVAKYFASGAAQQRCISVECGLQNGTLALFVGTQMFGENISTFIVPTAAYALIMMVTSIIFVFIVRKNT